MKGSALLAQGPAILLYTKAVAAPRALHTKVERLLQAKVRRHCVRFTHRVTPFDMFDSQACTSKMNLSDEVDLEDYVGRPDKISNADIAAICQEVRHLDHALQ